MQATFADWLAKHPGGAVEFLFDADSDEYERTEVTHGETLPELDDPCSLTIAEGEVAS